VRFERPTRSSAHSARALLLCGQAALSVHHGQLNVFERGRAREQVETLENEADFLVPQIRKLIAVESGNVHTI